MGGWKSTEEYEAQHGSQEAQARAQVAVASICDGPWRLEREVSDGVVVEGRFRRRTVVLDNSVRSTSREIEALKEREFERTNIVWNVVPYK